MTQGSRPHLDLRAESPYRGVAWRRQKFDQHITECSDCQGELCSTANAMWRTTVLASLRAVGGGA